MDHLTDVTTIDTTMESKNYYSKTEGEPLSYPTLHGLLVGSLTYLTVTQPEIDHDINIHSQFMSDP